MENGRSIELRLTKLEVMPLARPAADAERKQMFRATQDGVQAVVRQW